jgi:hypothetical protein
VSSPRRNDLTSQRFARWLVVEYAGTLKGGVASWLCRCDCGTEKPVRANSLVLGRSRSCGCLMRETTGQQARRLFTKHGHATDYRTTPEYRSWYAMINRCENSRSAGFKNYGARGIKVCARWRASFADFFADMGRKPTMAHTIDRYPNNDGKTAELPMGHTLAAERQSTRSRLQRHQPQRLGNTAQEELRKCHAIAS